MFPNYHDPEIANALMVKTNDTTFVLYLASLTRAIASMHNLINNRVHNLERETELQKKAKEKEETEKKEESPEQVQKV